jgi:hypothetical protein
VNLDANVLLAGLVMSGVGYVLWRYGRKMSRPPHMVFGLILMVYSYFIGSALWVFVVGAALLAALWGVVKLGW